MVTTVSAEVMLSFMTHSWGASKILCKPMKWV